MLTSLPDLEQKLFLDFQKSDIGRKEGERITYQSRFSLVSFPNHLSVDKKIIIEMQECTLSLLHQMFTCPVPGTNTAQIGSCDQFRGVVFYHRHEGSQDYSGHPDIMLC